MIFYDDKPEGVSRNEVCSQALIRLKNIAEKEALSDIEQDALIHRYEVCFELLWKYGKDYLLEVEGIEAASPKKVIRCLREVGIFEDEESERALTMADDRNMTVHTYDEMLAKEMAERIKQYEPLMRMWYERMNAKG